jgi:ABC-type multidrug transport system fused ATPase/permease subunit
MSAIGAGTNASNMPSVSKAKAAAKKIFEIVDEKSKVDVRDEKGEKVIAAGELEFKNVNFIYPSR